MEKKVNKKRSLPISISKNSGFISIVIVLGFTVWSSLGEPWHKYILNLIIIFLAATLISTNFIQGLTRGFSYFYLYRQKGILKMLLMFGVLLLFLYLAFFILSLVFVSPLQFYLFFIIYIILAIIITIFDNQFQIAIKRTKMFEDQKKNIKSRKIPITPEEIVERSKKIPELLEWSKKSI